MTEIPGVLADWIRRWGGDGAEGLIPWVHGTPPRPGTPEWEALATGVQTTLEAALARPGVDREGAHALLAADALLTVWAEGALQAEDPDAELVRQIRTIGALAQEAT